jgi:short-subunit dehydrogenase
MWLQKRAVITGHSSGIGRAIASKLRDSGYEVIEFNSRLEDKASLQKEAKEILSQGDIDVLVSSAGFGRFAPHEEISLDDISTMIDVNLKAPILLTNMFLRSLKKTQGHIINISSIEATKHSKFSALYTATKSGLRDFSLSLFEEVRKSGVKVTSINPDLTKTNFFDDLGFEPSSDPSAYIDPSEIADSVEDILNTKSVITDFTIRPQKLLIRKK